jgi:dephospho-CoA kinase
MKKNTIIIGIVGEKGSGKGTLAGHFVQKFNAISFRFSKILDDILHRLYVPNKRENQIKLVLSLRQDFGCDILASVLLNDIQKTDHELVIIDGIRYWDEVKIFRKHPSFHLIAISADTKTRFDRIKNRGEKAGEREMSYEQFLEEEHKPTEVSILDIAETADFQIDNNHPMTDLEQHADEIMIRILQK